MGKLTATHFKMECHQIYESVKDQFKRGMISIIKSRFCVEKKKGKITLLFIHLCIALKKMNEKYT